MLVVSEVAVEITLVANIGVAVSAVFLITVGLLLVDNSGIPVMIVTANPK